MNAKKKLKGASAFGIKVIRDKSLDKLPRKVMCPEKLEIAKKVASNLTWKKV